MMVIVMVAVVVMTSCGCRGDDTPGTKLIETFDNTLKGVQKHMFKGITSVSTPMVKFTVDTVPHLVHIYALVQGVVVHPKVVALVKEAVGRLTLFGGTMGSDAEVLGSSVLKDVAHVTGVVLEAQNKMAAKLGRKGIKLAGTMVEELVNVTSLGVDAAAVALTALGDTLVAASEVNGAMSGGSARLITAIGETIKRALLAAQEGVFILASPVLGVTSIKGQTTNMASYLSSLKHAQKVFDKLVDRSEKEMSKSS